STRLPRPTMDVPMNFLLAQPKVGSASSPAAKEESLTAKQPSTRLRVIVGLRWMGVVGHLLTATSFLLPWAKGAGPFLGRDFSGPQLASLARNADILIRRFTAGPEAVLFVTALWAIAVLAITGAVLLAGVDFTSNPRGVRRLAAATGLATLILAASA